LYIIIIVVIIIVSIIIYLVAAAVLRDSLCVVSLLPCVADCLLYVVYTVSKVERFLLTIVKGRLLFF